MLELFFSQASRKAWVAGVLPLLLTPLYELLRAEGEVTGRTVLVALLAGAINAVAVFSVANKSTALIDDEPGDHAVDR